MKTVILFSALLGSSILIARSHGCLGRVRLEHVNQTYVYLAPNPSDPEANLIKVTGNGYTAQIWYGVGNVLQTDTLKLLEGSDTVFTDEGSPLFPRACVADTYGGDRITAQIRVWDNRGGSVSTWAAALMDPTIAQGTSPLLHGVVLSGLASDGTPVLGDANLYVLMPNFKISIAPEPSSLGLLSLGIVFLTCWSCPPSREKCVSTPRRSSLIFCNRAKGRCRRRFTVGEQGRAC